MKVREFLSGIGIDLLEEDREDSKLVLDMEVDIEKESGTFEPLKWADICYDHNHIKLYIKDPNE
jgi:hypothetical protein